MLFVVVASVNTDFQLVGESENKSNIKLIKLLSVICLHPVMVQYVTSVQSITDIQ